VSSTQNRVIERPEGGGPVASGNGLPPVSAVAVALRDCTRPALAFDPVRLLIVGVSETAFELLGRDSGALEGVDLRDVVHRDESCAPTAAWELLTSGQIESYRAARRHIHRRDGRRVQVHVSMRIATVGGSKVGLAIIESDHRHQPMASPLGLGEVGCGVEGTWSSRIVEALHEELSARQREILTHLARGERVDEIAAAIYISSSTVRNHLSMIYRKFGVRSQAGLLVKLFDGDGEFGGNSAVSSEK
jgi:DNA-binding CsgD family transcriptional regulator